MVIVNEVDDMDVDLEVRVSGVMRLMILGIESESESESRGQRKMERVIDEPEISNDSCSYSYFGYD